jgi:hypothetical protein
VISRYVEVDRDKVEVNFEREDKALAMLANIPIKAVNRPTGGEGPKTEIGHVEPAAAAASEMNANEPEAPPASGAPPTRARKRRKKSGAPKPAAAH